MNGVAPSDLVILYGIVSLGVLIRSVRTKLTEYNDSEDLFAFQAVVEIRRYLYRKYWISGSVEGNVR